MSATTSDITAKIGRLEKRHAAKTIEAVEIKKLEAVEQRKKQAEAKARVRAEFPDHADLINTLVEVTGPTKAIGITTDAREIVFRKGQFDPVKRHSLNPARFKDQGFYDWYAENKKPAILGKQDAGRHNKSVKANQRD